MSFMHSKFCSLNVSDRRPAAMKLFHRLSGEKGSSVKMQSYAWIADLLITFRLLIPLTKPKPV